MNAKTAIGVQDVLLYVIGHIDDPVWSEAVEATRMTHPKLWDAPIIRAAQRDEEEIDGPDQTEDEVPDGVVKYYQAISVSGLIPRPKAPGAPPSFEELVRTLLSSGSPLLPPETLPPEKCVATRNGVLLLAHTIVLCGGDTGPTLTPDDVPALIIDDAKGLVTIRQRLDALCDGVIKLIVYKRISDSDVEMLCSIPVNLKETHQPRGDPYWGAVIGLQSLIREAKAGENLIYCVLPDDSK